MQKSSLGFALVLGGVSILLAACGGAVEPTPGTSSTSGSSGSSTSGSSPSEGNVGSTAPVSDPGTATSPPSSGGSSGSDTGVTCGLVEASAYDTSCATDADCAIVPEGGNTCTPCDPGDGVWGCPLVPISAKSEATYLAALHAGIAPYYGNPTTEACIVTSCPIVPAVSCIANVCTVY